MSAGVKWSMENGVTLNGVSPLPPCLSFFTLHCLFFHRHISS